MDEIIFTGEEIEIVVENFAGLDGGKSGSKVRKLLKYFGETGQVVVMEADHGNDYFVFANLETIENMVRQGTEPEDLLRRRLKRDDILRLK